jgi:hypothetical protein
MGVSDYISRTHHQDQFGQILKSYLQPAMSAKSQKAATNDESARSRSPMPPSVTAQVI